MLPDIHDFQTFPLLGILSSKFFHLKVYLKLLLVFIIWDKGIVVITILIDQEWLLICNCIWLSIGGGLLLILKNLSEPKVTVFKLCHEWLFGFLSYSCLWFIIRLLRSLLSLFFWVSVHFVWCALHLVEGFRCDLCIVQIKGVTLHYLLISFCALVYRTLVVNDWTFVKWFCQVFNFVVFARRFLLLCVQVWFWWRHNYSLNRLTWFLLCQPLWRYHVLPNIGTTLPPVNGLNQFETFAYLTEVIFFLLLINTGWDQLRRFWQRIKAFNCHRFFLSFLLYGERYRQIWKQWMPLLLYRLITFDSFSESWSRLQRLSVIPLQIPCHGSDRDPTNRLGRRNDVVLLNLNLVISSHATVSFQWDHLLLEWCHGV